MSHPIQYLAPVWRALQRKSGVELTVLYRSRMGLDGYYDPGFHEVVKWDIPLLGGYKARFLSTGTTAGRLQLAIVPELVRRRFDVLIVHGYNSLTNLIAVTVAKAVGTRIILRGDTRLGTRHNALTNLLKRLLFSAFDGFLTVGTLNREYYARLGVPDSRLFYAPFCVDNAVFASAPHERTIRRQNARRALELPQDSVVVLYASKLIRRKRPADVIEAFSRLSIKCPTVWLVVAGSGPEEQTLRAMVRARGLERVRFAGFINQSALPGLYAASDCFVLPSHEEPWGLVLNEVMAAALPVIVSDGVGAAPDLVRAMETGLVYPCGDVDALTTALETLLTDDSLRVAMGSKGQEHISRWDVGACADCTVSAVMRVAKA